MLKATVVTSDLTKYEPMLADYYRTNQTDWSDILTKAHDFLENDIKARGLLLRRLCKPLRLTDATKSNEDEIERTRLTITLSGTVGTTTFAFQGTNDDSNETWTTISTVDALSYTTPGEKTTTFSDTYKYYKITKTGTATAVINLIERSFEMPKTFLAISMALKTLQSQVSDIWEDKSKYYLEMYYDLMKNLNYSYDEDDDGSADADEIKRFRVTFTR